MRSPTSNSPFPKLSNDVVLSFSHPIRHGPEGCIRQERTGEEGRLRRRDGGAEGGFTLRGLRSESQTIAQAL